MKCGRCGIELIRANKRNAYYVQNANDPKTYRESTVTEYILEKRDGTTAVGNKYINIKQLEDAERIALEKDTSDKKKEISDINKELEVVTLDNKESVLSTKEQKLSEYRTLISDKQKIYIHTREAIKSVPKTLIICKDCKLDDDMVIW